MTKHGPTAPALHLTQPPNHRLRLPWADSNSTSSGSSRTYQAPPTPGGSDYYQEPYDGAAAVSLGPHQVCHYYQEPQAASCKCCQPSQHQTGAYLYPRHHYTERWKLATGGEVLVRGPSPQYDVVEGPPLNRGYACSSRGGLSSRPVTPCSVTATETGVDACGGHCVAFQTFCHYCLQVLFIAGILTGVSLTIAGSVLRSGRRGGDLTVLLYIGCLVAMVCTLLLSVQCCVRRNVKRRQRARCSAPRPALRSGLPRQSIPLQELGHPPPPSTVTSASSPRRAQQYEPLLRKLVEQQLKVENHTPTAYELDASLDRSDMSGVPWWRRQGADAREVPG